MKVLLLNPGFEPEASVGESRSVRFVLNVTPPLGLAYLAAVLKEAGHEVRLADYTSRYPYPALPDLLRDFQPGLVGLTATTPSFPGARTCGKLVKEILPECRVVIGGAQATACPEITLAGDEFDAAIIGEGEETIVELAAAWDGGGNPEPAGISGLAFRQPDGSIQINQPRPYVCELDRLPLPDLEGLPPLRFYHPTPASYRRLPVGIIMTSRGCPNRCTFCDRSIFGNNTRFHGTERVLAEVERLVRKLGAREIRFFDDTFTLNKKRTREICRGLRQHNLNIPWTCLTAVRSVDAELLQEMKAAGCWQVLYGLESGDDGMLRRLKKGNTVEANRRAIRWAKAAGMEVRGDFIVGTPGETLASLEATLSFAIEEKLDYAHFNKFTPFPGTELYRQLTAEGYSFDFNQGCSILDHGALLYVPPSLDPDQYRDWLDRAFKRFYLRPGHIFRRLAAIRTWPQLRGQLRGAFSIANL